MYRIESEISTNFSPGSRGTDLLIGLPIDPFCGPAAPCSGPSTLGLEAGSASGLPRFKSRTDTKYFFLGVPIELVQMLQALYKDTVPSSSLSSLPLHVTPENIG